MLPLFVNSPEDMSKVRVLTMRDYSEKTLKALHKAGVLHVEQSEELTPADKALIDNERGEVSKLLTCINSVLGELSEEQKVSFPQDTEVIYTRPFSELKSEVVILYDRISNLQHRTVGPGEELKRLSELNRYLEPLAQQDYLRLNDLNFSGKHFFSRVFVLTSEAYESLRGQLENHLVESFAVDMGEEKIFYAIGKSGERQVVESLVTEAEGKVLQIPQDNLTVREFLQATGDRIHSLEQQLAELYRDLRGEIGENLEKLVLYREVLSTEAERLLVLEKASEANYVFLIEGWIPERNTEATLSEIRESIDYVYIDTRKSEELEDPPTKLRNFKWLQPFEVIVKLFDIPKYREWDPTPIIAYSFALFFGLMMGDVIYGLGTILIARFLLRMFTDNPETEGFKLFQKLIYISGGVAVVIGLLSGTYLGDLGEYLGIKNLALVKGIQEALQTPLTFIGLSLIIGFIHVNIGHVLGLLQGIKNKVKGTIPGKAGLFLLELCGIPYILHAMLSIDIPFLNALVYSIFGYVLVLSIVLIIISSVIQKGAFLGGIFWLFDITGLLGDVMSYARIAGVGLATFYLAFCFNLMADLFSSMLPGVVGHILGLILAVIILLVGHILNLVLGALTGFIHSLRLCFVEFLFKFYEGGGREYSPFKLKTRQSITVGAKS